MYRYHSESRVGHVEHNAIQWEGAMAQYMIFIVRVRRGECNTVVNHGVPFHWIALHFITPPFLHCKIFILGCILLCFVHTEDVNYSTHLNTHNFGTQCPYI
jgi:hypothetical protein